MGLGSGTGPGQCADRGWSALVLFEEGQLRLLVGAAVTGEWTLWSVGWAKVVGIIFLRNDESDRAAWL